MASDPQKLDGFGLRLDFAQDATIILAETETSPVGGFDMGEKVDNASFADTSGKKSTPRDPAATDFDDVTFICKQDTVMFAKLYAIRGQAGVITWTYNDEETLEHPGAWLSKIELGSSVDGTAPMMTGTIQFDASQDFTITPVV